jgi:uncharacterized membrane protein YjgN (DUF898 family)
MTTLPKLAGPPRLRVSQRRHRDTDLLVVGALLWLASVARVVLELVHGQQFGVEATLALLCVIALPWLLRDSLRAR